MSFSTKSDKIVCVMVGLPARGKSYIAKRLSHYIQFFYGVPTKQFNVGDYRRIAAGHSFQPASFFDTQNEAAMKARKQATDDALNDLMAWMQAVAPHRVDDRLGFLSGDFGAVAIFDATNSTRERRAYLVERIKPTGAKIIFIESICMDEDVIKVRTGVPPPVAACERWLIYVSNLPSVSQANIMNSKVGPNSSKDYQGVDPAKAAADFEERIRQYQKVYESLGDAEKAYTWLKVIDGGRELSLNNIRGFLPSRIAQFLVNLHVHRRSFYFSRHGQSVYNKLGKIGGDPDLTVHGEAYATALGEWAQEHIMQDEDGAPVPARLWTSSLLRTRRTARHIPTPLIPYSPGEEPSWVNMRPKVFRNLGKQ